MSLKTVQVKDWARLYEQTLLGELVVIAPAWKSDSAERLRHQVGLVVSIHPTRYRPGFRDGQHHPAAFVLWPDGSQHWHPCRCLAVINDK